MDEIQYIENLALEMRHDYAVDIYGSVLGIATEENFIIKGWRMFIQWIKDAIDTVKRWWITHFRKDQMDLLRNQTLERHLIKATGETTQQINRVNSSYPLQNLINNLDEGAPEWIEVLDELSAMWQQTQTTMLQELIMGPSWPGTYSVDHAGLKLTEIHLPLPPECWD